MNAIIVSQKDPAGLNIKERLIELGFKETDEEFQRSKVYSSDETKLYTTEDELIHSENLDKEIEADFFIFGSRHRAASGVNSLSVHPIGNWDKADLGGKEGKLCIAPGSLLKDAFIELNKLAGDLDYEITVEQTHHGPFLDKPAMFIEIGSNEEQWKNKKAGEIIAQVIIKIIKESIKKYRTAVFLGGGHYNHNAEKIMLRTDLAVGHICAKFDLEFIDEDMILQAIDRTKEKADLVILDWKGLGQYKQRIVAILDKLGLEYERSKRILK